MANISVLVAATRNNTPIMTKLKTNKERDGWGTAGNSTKKLMSKLH